MAGRPLRRWGAWLLVAALVAGTNVVGAPMTPAGASTVPSPGSGTGRCWAEPPNLGCLFYQVDPVLTSPPWNFNVPDAVWPADQAWKIHGLTQQAELWNRSWGDWLGGNHVITYAPPGAFEAGLIADADMPCDNAAHITCTIRLNLSRGDQWNTSSSASPPGWIDLTSILVHEMGHWFGLDHSLDCPSSDGGPNTCPYPDYAGASKPSMYWRHANGTTLERTIQQDDENGLRMARPTAATNLVANGHIWEQSAWWGGVLNLGFSSWNNPSVAIYDDPQSSAGRYLWFKRGGAQSSVRQDLYLYDGANYVARRTLTPRLNLRAPLGGGQIQVVVWSLRDRSGGTPRLLYSRTCNLPDSWDWVALTTSPYCSGSDVDGDGNAYTFRDPSDSETIAIRYEVYNKSGGNADIDYVRLEF